MKQLINFLNKVFKNAWTGTIKIEVFNGNPQHVEIRKGHKLRDIEKIKLD